MPEVTVLTTQLMDSKVPMGGLGEFPALLAILNPSGITKPLSNNTKFCFLIFIIGNVLRVDSTTSINYDDEDGPQNEVSRELRTAAGTI